MYGEEESHSRLISNPRSNYMFKHTGANAASAIYQADTIPNSIFAVYELCFALVAPTVVASSVSGIIVEY